MAYIKRDPKEQQQALTQQANQQENVVPQISGGSSVVGSGSTPGGGAAKHTQTQTQQTRPTSSGSSGAFVNLQRYLETNAPQAQQLARRVASSVKQEGQQAQSAIQETKQNFSEAVDQGTLKYDEDLLDSTLDSLKPGQSTDELPTEEEKDRIAKLASGEYSGPESARTGGFLQQTDKEVSDVERVSELAKTGGGRKELLRVLPGSTPYAGGGRSLDQYLMHNVAPARERFQSSVDEITPILEQYGLTKEQFDQLVEQARESSTNVGEQTKQALSGAAQSFQETIDNRVEQQRQERSTALEQLREQLSKQFNYGFQQAPSLTDLRNLEAAANEARKKIEQYEMLNKFHAAIPPEMMYGEGYAPPYVDEVGNTHYYTDEVGNKYPQPPPKQALTNPYDQHIKKQQAIVDRYENAKRANEMAQKGFIDAINQAAGAIPDLPDQALNALGVTREQWDQLKQISKEAHKYNMLNAGVISDVYTEITPELREYLLNVPSTGGVISKLGPAMGKMMLDMYEKQLAEKGYFRPLFSPMLMANKPPNTLYGTSTDIIPENVEQIFNPFDYLVTQDPNALITRGTVTDPEEYARWSTLANMAGIDPNAFLREDQLGETGQLSRFDYDTAADFLKSYITKGKEQIAEREAKQQSQQTVNTPRAEKDYTAEGVAVGAAVGGPVGALIGGAIGSIFCYAAGTRILMHDGTLKNVEGLRLGDNVALGGTITACGQSLVDKLYKYKGTIVTGSHAVFEDGNWIRVEDSELSQVAENVPLVAYPVMTQHHVLVTLTHIGADVAEVDEYNETTDSQRLEMLNRDTKRNEELLKIESQIYKKKEQ